MDDFDKLKTATEQSLLISMVKVLILKDLNDKIKNKIDSKPNDFFKPSEQDLQNSENFKLYINRLSSKIIEEDLTDKS